MEPRRRIGCLRGSHGEGLVFSVCVEAGLIALATILADALEHGAGCYSANDLLVGAGAAIVAAVDAGPVALAAALGAAATGFGGPVGTAIGFVLAAASAPSLVELGGRAVTAVATNRGLKIGVQAGYPPVYSDYC